MPVQRADRLAQRDRAGVGVAGGIRRRAQRLQRGGAAAQRVLVGGELHQRAPVRRAGLARFVGVDRLDPGFGSGFACHRRCAVKERQPFDKLRVVGYWNGPLLSKPFVLSLSKHCPSSGEHSVRQSTLAITPPRPAPAGQRALARRGGDRLAGLRHPHLRARQRGAGLPRADRRPACRQHPPGDRKARLVEAHGRPRQTHRHRPALRRVRQRPWQLHGIDRTGQRGARWRPMGHALPRHHHPRHGARTGRNAGRQWVSNSFMRVVGGSMGGMQALSLAANWPERAARVLAIATTARHIRRRTSPFTRSGGRRSWPTRPGTDGDYYAHDAKRPTRGWRWRVWRRI